jgi:hypothetical protein
MTSDEKGKKRNFEPDKSLIVKDGSRQAHFKPLMEKEVTLWSAYSSWESKQTLLLDLHI